MKVNSKVIIGGLVATAAMTIGAMIAPLMGMSKMDVPGMLAGMLNSSIGVGWVMHFMIGTIFAIVYALLVNDRLHIHNNVLRGLTYGFFVFIFAQIMMVAMGAMGLMPPPPADVSMMGMMMVSLIGHLIYGAVLGAFVPQHEHVHHVRATPAT
jgi:uncharacterized membrane protein YagU involved in acid resistance